VGSALLQDTFLTSLNLHCLIQLSALLLVAFAYFLLSTHNHPRLSHVKGGSYPTMSSNRPKVLCPEKLSPDGLTLLRATLEVDERKGLTPDQLIEIIPNYEALLVRSETKVTAELLTAAKNLKVVARAGVGVDNVDVQTATKLGIVVVNSPSGNIGAAAEHTIALLMSMARNIPDGCASVKAGKWERSRLVGVELKGKTLCIIGLGKGSWLPSKLRDCSRSDMP
jgi:hypothetical protein